MNDPAPTHPGVTVVVPAYRRADRLRACLAALVAQQLPRERFDVVVVDDGSPTPLAPVVEELAGHLRVAVHRQTNAGPAAARNTGARLASGELLAFTDDDCEPEPAWLPALLAAHDAEPTAMLGGPVRNALAGNPFAEASQQLVAFLAAHHARGGRGRFFPSNNLAVPREPFVDVGGFDESFPLPAGEDRELGERWARSGRPLVAVPDAVVAHRHHMGPREFWRQHRDYGRGAWQVHRRRLEAAGEGLRVEGWGFYAGMLAFPFRSLPAHRAVVVAALVAVSQLANVVGFASARRSERTAAGAGA